MKIKLSKYIAKKLVELGINRGFSVTGGGAMHLNNGLGHQAGLGSLTANYSLYKPQTLIKTGFQSYFFVNLFVILCSYL